MGPLGWQKRVGCWSGGVGGLSDPPSPSQTSFLQQRPGLAPRSPRGTLTLNVLLWFPPRVFPLLFLYAEPRPSEPAFNRHSDLGSVVASS